MLGTQLGFEGTFRRATGGQVPYPWQRRFGQDSRCADRVVDLPPAMGKRTAAALTWMHYRVVRGDLTWPTRLVWVRPRHAVGEPHMVALEGWRQRLGLTAAVRLHDVDLGGPDACFADAPEHPTVIVGGHDELLARALGADLRGPRGRWPVDMGLLGCDTLWLIDDVPLLGPAGGALASVARERADAGRPLGRPSATWWLGPTPRLSATQRPGAPGLSASRGRGDDRDGLARFELEAADRDHGPWRATTRLDRHRAASTAEDLAQLAAREHVPGSRTVVIVGSVARAVRVHDRLRARATDSEAPLLVHERLRPSDRDRWRRALREPGDELLLVATDAVLGGAGLQGARLVTDLAVWPRLTRRVALLSQRASRPTHVHVVGTVDEAAAAEGGGALEATDRALEVALELGATLDLRGLEALEAHLGEHEPAVLEGLRGWPGGVGRPLEPGHLRRRFDAGPERSRDRTTGRCWLGQDPPDVFIAWRDARDWTGEDGLVVPPAAIARAEQCRVPRDEAAAWAPIGRGDAVTYDADVGRWVTAATADLRPGAVVVAPASVGGYDAVTGFDPMGAAPVEPARVGPTPSSPFDAFVDDEYVDAPRRRRARSTVAEALDVARHTASIARALTLPAKATRRLQTAARLLGVGRAHPLVRITPEGRQRRLVAQPAAARQELASALAIYELLRLVSPGHPAILGNVRAVLEALGERLPDAEPDAAKIAADPAIAELLALPGGDVDLVAWLVVTHRGRVRARWARAAADPREPAPQGRRDIRYGIEDGDELSAVDVLGPGDAPARLPPLALHLDLARPGLSSRYGRPWSDRVMRLVGAHGPLKLALLEAIMRAAVFRGIASVEGPSQDPT